MSTVSICEHKRRAINNWLHNALEEMVTATRIFLDEDGEGYIDDKVESVYEINATAMQEVINRDCKVCDNPNDTNV